MTNWFAFTALSNHDSGKSYTWTKLFVNAVRRRKNSRALVFAPRECVDVFTVDCSMTTMIPGIC